MGLNNYNLVLSVFLVTIVTADEVVVTNDSTNHDKADDHDVVIPVQSKGTLVNHPACKDALLDLAHGCQITKEDMAENDFAALSCAQNLSPERFKDIPETCEQVLWRFKMNLTQSSIFLDQIEKACSRDVEKVNGCKNRYPGTENAGHYMSCLIDEKFDGGLKPACEDFLTQVESVIFSDYRLIADFAQKCQKDIEDGNCGHIRRQLHSDSNVIFYHHSQGLVLECLTEKIDKVEPECKEEILHIAELQSDDFHLDRPLFFACKNDRKTLCPKVISGDGRIFQCLLSHKEDNEMSKECRVQLSRRQKLMRENYKVSRGLVRACKTEIKENQCKSKASGSGSQIKTVKLAAILLCLEEVGHNEDAVIGGPCQAEMTAHRKMLMEDYNISPELVNACNEDIENNCKILGKKGNNPGEVIHCLMRAVMEQKVTDQKCTEALQTLLLEADVASDWQVDPILKKSCQDVVTSACDPGNLTPDAVMNCLMNQLVSQSRHMTKVCSERLLEIQYFMARDFSLDPKLYRACHVEAVNLCQADQNWNQHKNHGQYIFACLARNLYGDEENEDENAIDTIGDQCADEIERVLEQRAISVNLHPEIEDQCRLDLTQNCLNAVQPGEELQCLQENFDNLQEECHQAIQQYTEMEAKNAILNPIIASTCHLIIDKECQEEVQRKDEGLVIQCLIKFREEQPPGNMDEKCSAAIEHWQLMSLKDYRFSFKFKESCKADIVQNCPTEIRTKAEVVACLSEIARNDILTEKEPKTLSNNCRKQLQFQLLQKHSSINLNPKIFKNCKKAIQKNCKIGEGNVLECLKSLNHNMMSAKCRMAVFEEQQEEVLIDGVDHELLIGCKHEIKQHCPSENEINGILHCLKEAKSDVNFDRNCKLIVSRRTRQQAKDYRLRPRLQKACEKDLSKFCQDILLESGDNRDTSKDFLEGKVIQCLQTKFVTDPDLVSPQCRHELVSTIRDAAQDYRANAIILQECSKSIGVCEKKIASATDKPDKRTSLYGSKIEECLKDLFKKAEIVDGEHCSAAIATLIEATHLDIQADPLLNRACALDVSKFCRDVPHGSGQQLKCLSNIMQENSKFKLENKCDQMLRQRLQMFDMALKVVPINGVQDLWVHMSNSPHKNYFLLIIFLFFATIFIIGLCCGRVTKKVHRELKNR